MADTVDYSELGSELKRISTQIQNINSTINKVTVEVNGVKSNVGIVKSNLDVLFRDFTDFVTVSENRHNLSLAETRLIKLSQELEQKYGHYEEVRRMTTGILQATDLGIIRGETMISLTEEITLKSPGYWLAPCLLALSAWINDQPDVANKALNAALKRDDEKTSLLFALICRRANRYDASLKWLRKYIGNQEPESLDRKFIIVLDAYVNGLLGNDSEGEVYSKLAQWMDHITNESDFIQKQRSIWGNAIESLKRPIDSSKWKYLKEYSHTWPQINSTLEYVEIHERLYDHFTNIFDEKINTDPLKVKLDSILDDLVSNYDQEEMPLREEKYFNQLIVDSDGDVNRAKAIMDSEKTAFEQNKDFASILTEVSMNPELSGSSIALQKYAISLCKDWVNDAYKEIVAQNRNNIPSSIEINVDTFNGQTIDGSDEETVLGQFDSLINQEMRDTLSGVKLSIFDNFCMVGGAGIGIAGVGLLVTSNVFLGIVCAIAGIGLIARWYTHSSRIKKRRSQISESFEQKRAGGKEIIRALIAEVVDFRKFTSKKDQNTVKVQQFLEDIHPDQYVTKLNESVRKIKMTEAE